MQYLMTAHYLFAYKILSSFQLSNLDHLSLAPIKKKKRPNIFQAISQQLNTCHEEIFSSIFAGFRRGLKIFYLPPVESVFEILGTIFLQTKNNQTCVKSVLIQSFFWSKFSNSQIKYGDFKSKSQHSIRIWENTNQKKLEIRTLFNAVQVNKISKF